MLVTVLNLNRGGRLWRMEVSSFSLFALKAGRWRFVGRRRLRFWRGCRCPFVRPRVFVCPRPPLFRQSLNGLKPLGENTLFSQTCPGTYYSILDLKLNKQETKSAMLNYGFCTYRKMCPQLTCARSTLILHSLHCNSIPFGKLSLYELAGANYTAKHELL